MYLIRAKRCKGGDPAMGATEEEIKAFKTLNAAWDFVRARKGWA